MVNEDRLARLRLIRTDSVGPVTYVQLIARFGDAASAIGALGDLARRGGGSAPRVATVAQAEAEIEAAERTGARHLFLGDADYPSLLGASEGAPPALIVMGDVGLFERRLVAMVGARNASAAGCRFARQLALALGDEGAAIVSGLARGIDTAAHQGSIESGAIAIVAGGIDIFYPPENEALQRLIGERGLLISEQPCGTMPGARHFPKRNRIIAGLAAGTVVIEAALRSGSLITARFAADFGREVMAVPGSPLDPRAQGSNQLIRDGATLVQNAADVIEALSPIHPQSLREDREPFDPTAPASEVAEQERETVIDLLGPVPVPVDELIRQAAIAPPVVHMVLLELELAGRLDRHAGAKVSLAAA